MLTIWTSAKAGLAQEAFAPALRYFKPNIPAHQFIAVDEQVHFPQANEVTLVSGNKALDLLKAHPDKFTAKNLTLSSHMEKPIKAPTGGHWLATYDPFVIMNDPALKEAVEWHFRLANRIQLTGSTKPIIGDYKWVSDFSEVITYVEQQYAATGRAVPVTCDTETMGFYPWYPDKDIVTVQFTAEPGTAHVLYLGDQTAPVPLSDAKLIGAQVDWLLTSPKVKMRGANFKYDLIWMGEKWGMVCTNFVMDTMLVGSILNENRSNSLSMHSKVFTDMGGYDAHFDATYDKGHMEAIPAEDDLLTYAGGDTDACQQVADNLLEQLNDEPKLKNFYINVLHPAARAFEKIERRGMVVDQQRYAELRDKVKETVDVQTKLALQVLPIKMRIKHSDKIDAQLQAGKSPLTSTILKEFFFTPNGLNLKPKEVTAKTNEPSTAKSHLRQFADHPVASQMVGILTELDVATKTLSTFIDGFLKHLRPDGRFHPTYFLGKAEFEGHEDEEGGTTTGRLSAKDPPIQVLPKKTKWAKALRYCFTAPKGKVVLSCDYSQGELKVVACVAPEPTMIASYEQGLDLHAVTGAQLSGTALAEFLSWKDNEDANLAALFEKHRGNAKPANFGLLYGMSAAGFQAYAWANYGVKLSMTEAEHMRDSFFNLYKGLTKYHERARSDVKKWMRVETPMGRIRHLPAIKSMDQAIRASAERQAINSPIQGCLSDMMLWAIALIEDAYPNGEIEIVATIHDALIAYVPEHEAPLWAQRITEVMANLPFAQVGWSPVLKFTADAEAGPDLAHLNKLKLAA